MAKPPQFNELNEYVIDYSDSLLNMSTMLLLLASPCFTARWL